MSNPIFLTNNLVLGSDLTVLEGGENAQYPLSNLKHTFTTKTFRSTSNTSSIQLDLKTSQPIDMFCIVGSALDGMGVTAVTIYGSATTDFSSSTPITVNLSQVHNFGFKQLTEVSHRFWKVELTHTGTYVELSNIYLGKSSSFTNGFKVGALNYQQKDMNKSTSNDYGQVFSDVRPSQQILTGTIQYCNSEEFNYLDDLYKSHGTHSPLWLIADPSGCLADESEYLFSGYFYFDKSATWKNSAPSLFDITVTFAEVI